MRILQKCLASWKKFGYKILKNLYKLYQVGKLWDWIFSKFLQKIGFISTNMSIYIFTIYKKREFIIVSLYINN